LSCWKKREINITIPSERTRAIINAEKFLMSLLDPKKTPRVPKEIRRRAGLVLRHFPSRYYLDEIVEKCPDVLGAIE